MVWIRHLILEVFWYSIIVKDLSISKRPIPKCEHQNWGEPENFNDVLTDLLIIHWRFSIIISHTKPFNHIKIDKPEESNRKQYWYEHAIKERNKDLHHDWRVLVVNRVHWASIQLFVCILWNFFGLFFASKAIKSTVFKSHHDCDGIEDEELSHWINSGDDHRLNQRWPNINVPILVDVGVLVSKRDECQNRMF